MMKKRIGNDIHFTWHIYRKSGDTQVPESFADKDVTIKLISPLQRPVTIEDVTIATGVVTFTFKGKYQTTLGNYVAVLQENKGEDGMVTLDVVDAVTLVPHSYMEEDGDEGDVIEAESVELESSISAGGGGGIEQQQADWAQTDASAVDFIKNKPNLDAYCRKDADNTHSDSVSDTYVKRVYHEQGGLLQVDRLTVGGDSIKFYHSHRGEETKELLLQLDDVEKLKNLPTATELTEEFEGKQDTINDLATIRSGAQAGATAVQPSEITPIDNRLDNVEYCLGDYLKSIYVFNWENHTTTTTEPIYTTTELYTTSWLGDTCECKLTDGSATISALCLGLLDSTNKRMYFTQAGTVTMYLVLLAKTSSYQKMISIYDGSGNIIKNIFPGQIPYNSQHICTPITFEVEAGYYLQMAATGVSVNALIWLGQIDFEIAGITEVKQIDKDVHANTAAIETIEQKIPEQASSSNKLVDKNSLASVATSGSYNDLNDTPVIPTIPTNVSAFNNDAGYLTQHQDLSNYVQKSQTAGLLKNDGTVDTTQYLSQHQDISGKADKSEMSVVPGTGADADKTTITLKQGTFATVLTAHQDISGKENVMPITTATGATLSAVVGNYYRLDNVGTLAITLPTITGATKLQAITFLLVCGSSALVTFAPQGSETILYQEDFALEADTTYEVTALWNGSEWTLSRVIYE